MVLNQTLASPSGCATLLFVTSWWLALITSVWHWTEWSNLPQRQNKCFYESQKSFSVSETLVHEGSLKPRLCSVPSRSCRPPVKHFLFSVLTRTTQIRPAVFKPNPAAVTPAEELAMVVSLGKAKLDRLLLPDFPWLTNPALVCLAPPTEVAHGHTQIQKSTKEINICMQK